MNTVSIVIDSEVLSKWKFDLISRICKVIDVKEFIILGKKSKTTFKGILLTFLTQNLSSLSLVGKFSSLPRVHDSDLFRASGDIIWLSDSSLPINYSGSIYFVGNCEGKNYSKLNYLSKHSKKNYGNFSLLMKKQKNVYEILSYSYTEMIGYNPIRTINQHLGSLSFLWITVNPRSCKLCKYSLVPSSFEQLSTTIISLLV